MNGESRAADLAARSRAAWLHAARIDLAAAEVILERLPPPACFHAQQAAEKSLKAVLAVAMSEIPTTYVLEALTRRVRALGHALPEELSAEIALLDQYYLPTRYPDALGGGDAMATYSVAQGRRAVDSARTLLSWCEAICAVGEALRLRAR